MSVKLIYGPPGSGKTEWANAQAGDHVKVVSFTDAYQRCRSTGFDWKPTPSFFQSLSGEIAILIIDECPALHQVKWADVYHAFGGNVPPDRIYLSQKSSAYLPMAVKIHPFSPTLSVATP